MTKKMRSALIIIGLENISTTLALESQDEEA